MKGIALGLPHHISAQMGSVAAAYALEHLGGLSHAYTWDEFRRRYEEHFGTWRFQPVSAGKHKDTKDTEIRYFPLCPWCPW